MKPLTIMLALLFVFGCGCCAPSEKTAQEFPGNNGGNNNNSGNGQTTGDKTMKIRINVGEHTFIGTLQDSETTAAFKQLLPMTITMDELNNNEKYYYLPQSLPVSPLSPGTINIGDLMLYGSNSIVVFYKTFSTSYRYSRLGKIDNPSGLEAALGPEKAVVSFEMVNE